MNFVHIHLSVSVSETQNNWGSPRGDETISFSVPSALFDEKKLASIVPSMMKVAEEKLALEKAKEELEAEGE
jgi:hypothetical protein